MTIVALDADPVSLNHSAKRVDRSRRKQRPLDTPPVPRRQLPTRGASNTDRLALLAHEEYRYCVNAKRKRPSDLHIDSAVAASTTSQDQRVHIGKKSKKSQARPTTNDQSTMKAVTSPELQEVASSVHIQRSARDFESSQQTSGIVQRRNAPSKRGKLNGKSSAARKKLRTSDSSARPAKRRRESDDGLNPIGILNSVMAQKMRSGVPAAAPDVPNGNASSPHEILCKRTHSQADIPTYQGDNQPPIRERKIAKEPRKSSNRERLADMPHLVLPPAVLGSPADLPEADRILQNAAAEGLLTLNNEMTLMEEWVDDQEPPEDLPSSDDEEDVPLSAVVASKRRGGLIPQFDSSSSMLSLGSLSRSCQQPRNVAASARSGASPLTVSRVRAGPGRRARPPSPLPKQPLYVQPLIWAESRQEVCESFDWFRSYQGGVYYVNDMVKGYLLSAFSSSRDMFAREGRFIISHGGGKAESMHSTNGQAELFEADDQREDDKSVRALLRTYHMKRPVVLIADDRYALFPYDLAAKGYTYVVLGFYHIAHAWAEREPASNGKGTVVRWKFAFQWCMRQPGPWWLTQERPPNAAAGADLDHGASAFTYFCPSCLKASPFVYEHVGMCLQPDCPTFWTLNGGKPPEDLRYHPTFLNAPFQCDHETMEDISPLPPATGALDGVITSRRFCKGWHCRKCGRLSSRYKWEHWECSNCGAVLQVYGKNRSPKEFWAQINVHNFMHHKCSVDAGRYHHPPLQRFRAGSGSGLYHLYILPENRGRIYLILGSPLVNRMADEIFEEYQEQARSGELLFQRWPLKSLGKHTRCVLSTTQCRACCQAVHQYVGGTANTVPFDSAPSAVVKARDLIQERMTSVLPADSGEYVFNEVLSAAYMEKQKMAFHSDSERGLGPRVASLSLGSAAFMHFRLHRKYSAEKGSSSNPPALSLFLRHGDVLIMDGAAIQEYYEHTVVPLNFRIAATARYIGAK
ncbi:hypothetical protein BD414DRAFT_480733 [Trametes punicea]|nr:hypothetical protein BD414DRAFT_480733 [Trametes punicea]